MRDPDLAHRFHCNRPEPIGQVEHDDGLGRRLRAERLAQVVDQNLHPVSGRHAGRPLLGEFS